MNKSLGKLIDRADAIVVGAGAGLSTSAGYVYDGERFDRYFHDFRDTYGIEDMYSGGFYPFASDARFWGWWARQIWVNRYMPVPSDLYDQLHALLADKDYFVLTTNVDHAFQRAGFDKQRLFYTQGDYGLWQCASGKIKKTYENKEAVKKMLESQGWIVHEDGRLEEGEHLSMDIDPNLIPVCPESCEAMVMNLRQDNRFVEDAGWHAAAERYERFLEEHKNQNVLFLELGVGSNTPGIIKYPFWRMTYQNPNASYVCINKGQAFAPKEIEGRSLCIDGDIRSVLNEE